ncbi:PAS domain-containing protein [Jannaschia ovalis]|uniref:PAS domain-containing protein n=1 Tax=Jannaschia ovalis TaxID=3038773 RepID=A0ABY8LFC7_9RHOB|nr:PAS domain-containing protein [Jannaschia sp. GRR-S6-38]WGH78800.1 PAS domain-containing protein [Jannaschia sp. GRR-S6-38]
MRQTAMQDGEIDERSGESGGGRAAPRLRVMRPAPVIETARGYWQGLRVGRNLPRRDALDPKDMGTILAHAMILDRVRPGTVRIRLAGRVINSLLGMDARGLPLHALFEPRDRTRLEPLIETVFDRPATLECDGLSEGAEGIMGARLLLLPLLDRCYAPSKALGVVVTDRPVQDPPRRFSMTCHELRDTDAPAPDRQPLPTDRFPEMAPAPRFEARETQVPWLRVVK